MKRATLIAIATVAVCALNVPTALAQSACHAPAGAHVAKAKKKSAVRVVRGGVVYRKRTRKDEPRYSGVKFYGCSFTIGRVVELWRPRIEEDHQGYTLESIKLRGRKAIVTGTFNFCGAGATVTITIDMRTAKRNVEEDTYDPEDGVC